MAAAVRYSRYAAHEELPTRPGTMPLIRVALPEYPEVLDLLARREWKPILQSDKLFWLLFCHASIQRTLPRDDGFDIALEEPRAVVQGRAHIIQAAESLVERIREIACTALSARQRSAQLNFANIATNTVFCEEAGAQALIGQASPTDASTAPPYVLPTLPSLFEYLNIAYAEKVVKRPVLAYGERRESDVQQITLSFDRLDTLSYAIAPIPISAKPLPDRFYEQWRAGQFCDVTLVAQGGVKIPAQAAVLDALGGEAVQAWFRDGFKESKTKEISFPDTSAPVLRAALEFLYKGPAGIPPEAAGELPLLDLYAFAHRWQIADLMAHSINLLSMIASPEDAPSIRDVQERMPHPQLQILLDHYTGAPAAAGAGGAAAEAGGAAAGAEAAAGAGGSSCFALLNSPSVLL